MTGHRPFTPLLAGLLLAGLGGCAHMTTPTHELYDTPVDDGSGHVTADDFERSPSVSLQDLLAGRVAGVQVSQTSNGLAIRIRGATSLAGDAAPLYVVDGVAIEPGPAGSLVGLSARDIASIEVIKDAVGMTMYGARGANGVIVIRTKRPGF